MINDKHKSFYDDFAKLLQKHSEEFSQLEVLAIVSNIVGKVLAMQDQTKYTAAQLLNMVSHNIEIGNAEAIEQLLNTKGNA